MLCRVERSPSPHPPPIHALHCCTCASTQDHLGLKRVYACVGGSLGGIQALAAGALFPDRVERLVSVPCFIALSPYNSFICLALAKTSGFLAPSGGEYSMVVTLAFSSTTASICLALARTPGFVLATLLVRMHDCVPLTYVCSPSPCCVGPLRRCLCLRARGRTRQALRCGLRSAA